MPELPEVESVRRSLLSYEGARIERVELRRGDLRWPLNRTSLEGLAGRRIGGFRRRAKYLLVDVDDEVLLVHLGMSGVLRSEDKASPTRKHDHVRILFEDGRRWVYEDPRRFGWMDAFPSAAEASHPRLGGLGVEPLDPTAVQEALQRAHGRRTTTKQVLMDAKVVVGIGNIYASEILFAAGVRPQTPMYRVGAERRRKIAEAAVEIMREAIAHGGTTLKDYRRPDGAQGGHQGSLRVYARAGEGCSRCQGRIRQKMIGQRSTFYCAQCQH